MAIKELWSCSRWSQSCKNPGSVVALLQENFEKIMNLGKFLREKKRVVLSQLEKMSAWVFAAL